MNTYYKFMPNVFLAKCTEKHEKGETIQVTTKYGKENDSIVFNLIAEKDGFFYYSIVRSDGFNYQEYAKRKAEKLKNYAVNAKNKSNSYYNKSNEITKHIPMGQPILVGHHSEKRHRRDLNKSWEAMGKSVDFSKKSEQYETRSLYWEDKSNIINLSMPESIDYFEYKLEKAKQQHEGLKNGTIERGHSFSLTYAKKEVNELQKKFEIAKKLWA
jgi:hypothetical protein